MMSFSPFVNILLSMLIGLVLGLSLVLLYEAARIHIDQIKKKRKENTDKDDISLYPDHPEVQQYRDLMINGFGISEWVVEDDLVNIKTLSKLKKINKELKKVFPRGGLLNKK